MNIRKLFKVFITVCLIAGIIAGCTVVDNTYVATVNGEKLTRAEFMLYYVRMQSNMLAEAGVQGEEIKTFWETTEIEGKKALDVAKDKALQEAVEIMVVGQKAKEKGITLSEEQLAEIESQIAGEISQYNSKADFDKELEYMNTTEEAFRNWTKSVYLANTVAGAMFEDESMTVTDEEAKESIKQGYVKAKHILLMTVDEATQQPLTGDKLIAVREQITDIQTRIKNGEDFDTLMNQYTQDPGIETNPDGYEFGKGEMVPEFETAAFALEVGEVSDIVTTDYGYHIIKREPLVLTDAKIEELLPTEKNNLMINNIMEEIAKWVAESDVELEEKVIAKLEPSIVE